MKNKLPIRIYYEDTDAGGVVYYANYLRYAERGRTELFHQLGFSNTQFLDSENPTAFMVKKCEIDYQKPARLEDDLILETEIAELSGASMTFLQTLKREEDVLVVMKVLVVCAALKTGRPARLPSELRRKIETSV